RDLLNLNSNHLKDKSHYLELRFLLVGSWLIFFLCNTAGDAALKYLRMAGYQVSNLLYLSSQVTLR
ncbi:MAG TPA: hypothetical protein PLW43_10265, partial [Chitinophagales bacterium]|nr:hypothetical protein [Chitinophagales bacterium]